MLPTKFQLIWPSGFRGEDFSRNRPIRNNNCLWWPCLFMNRDKMSMLYKEPPIDASYQVSVHLAKRFQRRRLFRNQPIRNKNCLWWPCLFTDRHENSNFIEDLLYILPTKFWFTWPSGFRGEEFFLIDQSEKRIAYGGHDC